MIFKRISVRFLLQNIKKYSTKEKPKIEINESVIENVESGIYKARKHPGIFKTTNKSLPTEFVKAAERALADFPVKQILNDSQLLTNYLHCRHPPVEVNELRNKKESIQEHVYSQYEDADLSELSTEQINQLKHKLKRTVIDKMQKQIYNWKAVNYNVHTSLQYLLGRAAPEYATLVKIFNEIATRDPDFKPRSLFDFGSGIGTVTWAAKTYWKKTIYEYFNVDASSDMNDLALILLKGGTGQGTANLKGVFYRQFLPATNTSYDLVVSAYSLFELPSAQTRLETILKLWNKTEKYLVLVEQGTNAGFKLISEARDFILDIKDEHNIGHCFSPCPHENPCPRFLSDATPCNFEISYTTIPIGQTMEHKKERFSYVVLKKGRLVEKVDRWPRIVRPTLVRSRHSICRLCTSNGKLEEVIFTASKHGKTMYHCARSSKWGDLLPIKVLPQANQDTIESKNLDEEIIKK